MYLLFMLVFKWIYVSKWGQSHLHVCQVADVSGCSAKRLRAEPAVWNTRLIFHWISIKPAKASVMNVNAEIFQIDIRNWREETKLTN